MVISIKVITCVSGHVCAGSQEERGPISWLKERMVISVAAISCYLCFRACLCRITRRTWPNQLAEGENGYQCSSFQLLLVFRGMFGQDHKKNVAQSEPERLSSLVWICTSQHNTSRVNVIDANSPGDILDCFRVSSAHILCIASIPGERLILIVPEHREFIMNVWFPETVSINHPGSTLRGLVDVSAVKSRGEAQGTVHSYAGAAF